MSRALAVPAAVLAGLLTVAGCGSGADSSGSSGSDAVSAKPDSSGTATIDITVEGDKITPQGAEVQVEAGQPLKLHITADAAGEVHVHSSPEHEFEYAAGTTDETITLEQPGVVDVESHTLDKLIVQLEVR